MITKININNFKAIKSLMLVPTSLNLFMGLNGMGKSTVIQSLLLLRQSLKSGLKQLSLNGSMGVVKMLYITLRKLKKFTLTLILFKTRKKKNLF